MHSGILKHLPVFTPTRAPVLARLSVWLQYLLPKQLLTSLAGRFATQPRGRVTTAAVRWFVQAYGVNMQEASEPDIAYYDTFNAFFTRPLAPNARPIAASDLVCPVDGAISQCGAINGDKLLQAKGHHFTTTALLGGDAALAAQFGNGQFATIYLSPKDYHRIHMPCAGRLTRMLHVPGALFSVNQATARGVPGLFARNERVVCLFEGERGPFVMVLVGATIVGSMSTVWHGVVNPPRPGTVREWRYAEQPIALEKGAEMGQFLLGSTVVLLFPRDHVRLTSDWRETRPVRLGEPLGEFLPPMKGSGA